MTIEPRERKTTIAHLLRVRPDYIEIRYDMGVVLSAIGVGEVQVVRRELMGNAPYGMLTIVPDDADFELGAIQVDYLAADRTDGNILAIAVVARTNMLEMILKLYFSYFPALGRLLVTDNEVEARAWLDAQFEETARTGS